MLVADVHPSGQFETLAADREVTRLGESVFQAGVISDQAADLVCGVLARMATVYKRLDPVGIRAVATAAVRDASNQREFIERASRAAGVPVEIISGREEARLIHLGVTTVWPHPKQRIMIVDVGGGSGEIIVAENGQIGEAFSKPLGAVRLTGAFLKDDPPKPDQLARMQDFIAERLAPVIQKIGVRQCDRAIATSSTAAAMVCAVNRVPRARRDEADKLRATLPQVTKLYRELCERDLEARSRVTGIGPRRAQIIVPGIAVLLEVMRRFHLPALHYSTAGVREGLIADLGARGVGSERMQLARDQRQEVERVASRYQVPLRRARKVAGFARTLFQALRPLHKLHPDWAKPLEAAAFLIDAGHFIADTAHHKHSEYIVLNSDLPGFTDQEKIQVACLCRFHRKSMPSARHTQFQQLVPEIRRNLLFLIPILRIADALDSGRELRVESFDCEVGQDEVTLRLAGQGRIDLEQWTVERVAPAFESVYQKKLVVAER